MGARFRPELIFLPLTRCWLDRVRPQAEGVQSYEVQVTVRALHDGDGIAAFVGSGGAPRRVCVTLHGGQVGGRVRIR